MKVLQIVLFIYIYLVCLHKCTHFRCHSMCEDGADNLEELFLSYQH